MAFYVYELVLLNGQIFYVGKGSSTRIDHHRYVLARSHLKEYQRNVYKRMRVFLAGREFEERIVFMTDDETAALLKEHDLILHYGFENLVNTQSHAFTGRKLKPEVGQIIAARLRGKKMPLEVRKKIGKANKGRIKSPEECAKISVVP